jgi:DNA-binding transcriptional LysR family regulator
VRERITIEQLRTFIACVEQGSFSGAARKLKRTQSVVSQTIAHLERQVGGALFDRSGRLAVVTDHGRALLSDARAVTSGVDGFMVRARELAEGREFELGIAVDVLFPMDLLTHAVGAFHQAFPKTRLRLHRESLGAVLQPVIDEECGLAVMGPQPDVPESLSAQPLLEIPAVTVAAPSHPLAAHEGLIPQALLARHVQLVVMDRSRLTAGHDFGVLSPLTWRLGDLATKQAFLRAGLGWGHMPRPHVEADLAGGALVLIRVEGFPFDAPHFAMRSVYRKDTPPGPEGRWFLERLRMLTA